MSLTKEQRVHGRRTLVENRQQRVCDLVMLFADGTGIQSRASIRKKFNSDTSTEDFLRQAGMLPWLTIERSAESIRFTIDPELKAICDGNVRQPLLGGASLNSEITALYKEVQRRRKENYEYDNARTWSSSRVKIGDQTLLLNWIEAELARLCNAIQPDCKKVGAATRQPNKNAEKDDPKGDTICTEK